MPPSANAAAEPLRVSVRRIIARPVSEVYRAWTTPEAIAQWISPGLRNIRVAIEPRVGGRFRIDLEVRGVPWFQDGEVLEVIPERRIRFSWVTSECPRAVGSVVTVNFRGLGQRTEIHLLHEGFPDERTRQDHDAPGWQQIVEVFVEAAGGELTPSRLSASADAVVAAMRGASYRGEVCRMIARPAAQVFAAWMTPACMEHWICPGGSGARVTADIRVGGKFHIDMLGTKGEVWPHDGEYLEVDPPRRLVFTWVSYGETRCAERLGSVISIDFIEREGATEVVLVQSGFPTAKSRADHVLGWTEIMAQLEAVGQVGFSGFGTSESGRSPS